MAPCFPHATHGICVMEVDKFTICIRLPNWKMHNFPHIFHVRSIFTLARARCSLHDPTRYSNPQPRQGPSFVLGIRVLSVDITVFGRVFTVYTSPYIVTTDCTGARWICCITGPACTECHRNINCQVTEIALYCFPPSGIPSSGFGLV